MDPIKAYLKDVRHIPLLTPEEEIDLAKRVQKGDKEARDRMIRSNLRLVISIAKRYMNLGVPLPDLIEEGNIGLMKSVEKLQRYLVFMENRQQAPSFGDHVCPLIAVAYTGSNGNNGTL